MWTVRSLLFVLFWKAGVDCRNVEGLARQEREKVNVTFSQTLAVTKTIDTDKLPGFRPGPAQDHVKPPGCNHGRPHPILLPQGPLLPVLDGVLPVLPNDGIPGIEAVPPGTPEPPQFPGIPGPTMPPMPPIPTGIDIEVLEGESGGQLGDRCPSVMKDENGKFPDFCYDVIDENGACILDDIIAPKDDCIAWFGEDFYNELVETQRKIEENRTQALDNAGVPGTTPSPEEVKSEDPEEEAEKNEAIAAEGRSVELEALSSLSRQPVRRGRASLAELARRDGPVMNTGVLDSLGYLETEQVGPTLGYFQSLGRKKKDGPQFNMAALNSLNYLQTEVVGPTLGYFQSLGRKERSPADREERGGPQFNADALNDLEDSKNANGEEYSPDSSSWSNSIVLPDAGPSKP